MKKSIFSNISSFTVMIKKNSARCLAIAAAVVVGFSSIPPIKAKALSAQRPYYSTNYTLTGDGATDIVAVAMAQNKKSESDLNYDGRAWCAYFVSDCAILANQKAAIPENGLCSTLHSNIIGAGGKDVATSEAKVGDICFYDWPDSSGKYNHVGIVYKVSGSTIYTIDGNFNMLDGLGYRVATHKASNIGCITRPAYKTTTPRSVAVKFHRNTSSSDTYTVTETFTVGVSNQKFGYKTDGTGRYSYMNEPNVGFGQWVNPGYELLGWNTDKNATDASYKTYCPVVDSWIQKNAPSIDFYAVWKKSELDSISVSTPPTAVIYENGSSFSKDGMVVTAKYACGSTKVVTDYEISYDFSKTGTANVTISYTEDGITKTTVQAVTVQDIFKGKGNDSSPFLVNTAADLENVAKMVNNPLANGCYGHASYKQTADIDLSAYSNWTPIGVYNVDFAAKKNDPRAIFRGMYNGNYHKITNLTVDTNGLNAGLFGRLNYTVDETTVIENLSVSGNITGQPFPNNEYAGGIAAVAGDGAIIRNCDFTGTVNGTDHVGGIAGKLHNGGTIENCYANAKISSATGNVGGICGTVSSGEYAVSYDAIVKNCYFIGELSDGKSIGGISGLNVKGDKSATTIKYINNYYLNSAASGGVAGAAQAGCTGLISSQLKTIAADLGTPFAENPNEDLNKGYPVFEWQLKVFGDANCDGQVLLNDAVLILQYLGNPDTYQLSAEGLAASDVSGNGDGITNKDALAIQRFVLHIIPSLPEL